MLIAAGAAIAVLALFARTARPSSSADIATSSSWSHCSCSMLPNLPTDWGFPLKGLMVNGSRLWIVLDLGFTTLQFQPAEIAKLGFVIYVAAYLADHQTALCARRAGIWADPVSRAPPADPAGDDLGASAS